MYKGFFSGFWTDPIHFVYYTGQPKSFIKTLRQLIQATGGGFNCPTLPNCHFNGETENEIVRMELESIFNASDYEANDIQQKYLSHLLEACE